MTYSQELLMNLIYLINQAIQDLLSQKAIQDILSTNIFENGIYVIAMIIKMSLLMEETLETPGEI